MFKRSETITTLEAQYCCVFKPRTGSGYTVTCPALPEIVTYGATLEQGAINARERLKLVLECYQEEGTSFPDSDIDPAPTSRSCLR